MATGNQRVRPALPKRSREGKSRDVVQGRENVVQRRRPIGGPTGRKRARQFGTNLHYIGRILAPRKNFC
jgi:hypothetical protein